MYVSKNGYQINYKDLIRATQCNSRQLTLHATLTLMILMLGADANLLPLGLCKYSNFSTNVNNAD